MAGANLSQNATGPVTLIRPPRSILLNVPVRSRPLYYPGLPPHGGARPRLNAPRNLVRVHPLIARRNVHQIPIVLPLPSPLRLLRPPVRSGYPIKARTSVLPPPYYPFREKAYSLRQNCTSQCMIHMVKRNDGLPLSPPILPSASITALWSGTPRPYYLSISLHTCANLTRNGTSMPRTIHPAMADSPTTTFMTRPSTVDCALTLSQGRPNVNCYL